MKVAIVGSRNYPDLEAVRRFVRSLPHGTTVVSGGAPGVDRAAAQAARARGLEVEEIFADWSGLGREAGFVRNSEIVRRCDRLVAFWDGFSRGTRDSLDKAMKTGKPVEVVYAPKSYPSRVEVEQMKRTEWWNKSKR